MEMDPDQSTLVQAEDYMPTLNSGPKKFLSLVLQRKMRGG